MRIVVRSLAALAAAAGLSGCAMHHGDRKVQMDAMHESPMHRMMQDMGCAHDPAEMQRMQNLSKEEKHAQMKAHMQACTAKLRQRAADEALARIDTCIEARMAGRAHKRMAMNKMRAAMMADLRACAGQTPPSETAPAKPSAHDDGH